MTTLQTNMTHPRNMQKFCSISLFHLGRRKKAHNLSLHQSSEYGTAVLTIPRHEHSQLRVPEHDPSLAGRSSLNSSALRHCVTARCPGLHQPTVPTTKSEVEFAPASGVIAILGKPTVHSTGAKSGTRGPIDMIGRYRE